MDLFSIMSMTEEEARELIEAIIWRDGPVCPHCKNTERIYTHKGSSHRAGLYSCGECRKQFTVTVGTVLERSRIPLKKWVAAFFLISTRPKGVSANQLHKDLKITYKTAWFMCHRIRTALEAGELGQMKGTVEVDETYVGGKPRKLSGKKHTPGRGTEKTPVVVLVSRDGEARARAVEKTDGATLKGYVREHVDISATIMTDEWSAYKGLGREYASHQSVSHRRLEYARGDVHVNTAESFFALLKRSVYGTFHHISKQHMDKYCHEFAFHWTHREASDGLKTLMAIHGIKGKRLYYKEPIGRITSPPNMRF